MFGNIGSSFLQPVFSAGLLQPPFLLLPPTYPPPDRDSLCHGVTPIPAELQPQPKFGPRQGRAGRKTDGGREQSAARPPRQMRFK